MTVLVLSTIGQRCPGVRRMKLYDQIVAGLESLAQPGTTGELPCSASEDYWHMGVDTPIVRRVAGRLSKGFCSLPWIDQVAVAQRFLEYGSDEAAHLGVFLLAASIDDATFVDAHALDSMVEAFRGWSVTDAFCIEVLQPLLARYTSDVLSLTAGWATARCRWKRRASVVVFARKVGASGRYTSHGLRGCECLITDSDDLVRKGVGWALKDLMRGDREAVLAYVASLRQRGVTSVITLYALRDIRGAARQRVLAIKP